MKKYLFLMPLFLLVLIPSSKVFAFTGFYYEKNGESIEMTTENFIYYAYYTYPEYFSNYKYFLTMANDSESSPYLLLTNVEIPKTSSGNVFANYDVIGEYVEIYCNVYNGYTPCKITTKTKSGTYYGLNKIIHSNYKIGTYGGNITNQDLEDYFGTVPIYTITYYINNEVYKTIELEKGSSHTLIDYDYNSYLYNFSGWNVETTDIDLNNITGNVVIRATLEEKIVNPVYINNFPITKEEFYVLLCLISILIMFEFLRFVFPFKGGKNL